ncbi:putative bifunctional diguanylate cyclase/phosphodiesterase [Solicola sp. PLA-1-18]|uniref:putative bifunctional diguanylate cyclase/phosphodiesterase n=1 Tax=Solicola sp. PLA-1-18 TaxID=3380532 RepID=UPI003B78BB2B
MGRRAGRLFALYTLASLVPVLVLGGVLVHGYEGDGERHALEQGRAQAEVIEQMAVGPALKGADPALDLSEVQRTALWSATDLAVFHGSVARLRVIGFDGRIAFSDDGTATGRYDTTSPAFTRALEGSPVAELVAGTDGNPTTIGVLQPIVTEATGQAVGILEVQLPYQDIAATVAENERAAFVRLGLGLLALYLVLAAISWWTTRALARRAADHEHLAMHDSLTGLPNRAKFQRLAAHALDASSPTRKGGLVLIDLNRFKEVNDTMGHHAGDELLQIIGRRLAGAFRSDDVVARLGGDEFAVLLRTVRDEDQAMTLLERARERVRADIVLDGVTVQIDASLGLCLFPDDAVTVEELLQHADAAMYEGKRGPSNVVRYQSTTARPDSSSLILQREIAQAIAEDQLFLEYQPKIELGTGGVVGVEALVRWQHPVRGRVGPDAFVPVAERSQQIDQLTRWVVDAALRDCASWRALGADWTVAVNVSARNLGSPSFVEQVLGALAAHDVPPDQLVLEITETAVPFDSAVLRSVVVALEEARVRVSLDDFGAGVTNLAQLRTVPFSELKIDRQFVDRLDQVPANAAIVSSLIEMGHRVGCTVVAEGVETAEVAAWLADRGCDLGQGYHWMRPRPWRDVLDDAPRPAAGAGLVTSESS